MLSRWPCYQMKDSIFSFHDLGPYGSISTFSEGYGYWASDGASDGFKDGHRQRHVDTGLKDGDYSAWVA